IRLLYREPLGEIKSSINGILAISFSDRIQQILVRNMASIVVVFPSSMMVRIRLPGLLGFLYKKKILEEIGGLIGTVNRLDFQIDKGLRGKFARMIAIENLTGNGTLISPRLSLPKIGAK
ncbi:hypothetical protein Gorai_013471, partial [Gossypium raimondii]|nr:hypothetical protein [Gossypium raimondii]